MDADRQIWQQKHIWLTSDTEWFIPFWFQFIIVYQCLSAVQTRFRSSFRSVSAFTHLGCSKSCQAESSHLNQPQSSIQSFHVAKSGHIGSYGFSWWIQRCCFDGALHFNTSWWALDHRGGRKDEFWWCMYGLPYDVCNYNVWCLYDVYMMFMSTLRVLSSKTAQVYKLTIQAHDAHSRWPQRLPEILSIVIYCVILIILCS